MARVALYTALNRDASSTKSSSSYAFNVSSQPSKYPNIVKPLNLTDLDKKSKAAMPNNLFIDYTLKGNSMENIKTQLRKTLNITEVGAQSTFSKYAKYYNRFKLPTVNDAFQKGFAHVFFLRPNCNLLNEDGSALNSSFESDPEFLYTWRNNKDVVKQLVRDNGQMHDFMLSLSNKATSFTTQDEYIETDTYGKTFKGWKVAYGRNNVDSKTAGDFTVSYDDDKNLHIYQLNKLWVDYISEVYQGRKAPKSEYIRDKILDYASACYYIITAEDGETIIFWSKYYGVFPSTIPSNQFSWSGKPIEKPQLDIKYQFSFKEDMNPESLAEFNMNAGLIGDTKYIPSYDPKLGHAGRTWVGSPYIELVTNNTDPECPYTFKLRFRPND